MTQTNKKYVKNIELFYEIVETFKVPMIRNYMSHNSPIHERIKSGKQYQMVTLEMVHKKLLITINNLQKHLILNKKKQ